MSIEIMNAVWRESKSDGRARLVLLAIADHQGEIGAWPSIATLAKMVNGSERSVQRDIKYLQAIGELKVEVQNAPTRKQYKSNLYWVTLPGVTNGASGVTDSTPGVTNEASRGDTVGVQNLNRTIIKRERQETLLPSDWKPSQQLLEMFNSKWPLLDPEYNIEQFLLHFQSVNSRKKDWDKTFMTWMNKEQKYHESRGNKPQPRSASGVSKSEIERKNATEFLREQEELAAKASPPPKCPHGESIARCVKCLRS